MKRESIRPMVRGLYQTQKLRIQTGNRIVACFKSKLGQEPGVAEKDSISKEGMELLDRLRAEYKLLADGTKKLYKLKNFDGCELISELAEVSMIGYYDKMCMAEDESTNMLKKIIKSEDLWKNWLENVKGIGPMMAGVLFSEIDIYKATYSSSLWKLAGVDVAQDGAGRSRREEHLIDVAYINKKGEDAIRKSITFNPFLKTKLLGVLAPSFLKCKGKYSEIYYEYKNRLINHPNHKSKEKIHIHNMSMRYMIKRFLVDLYVNWRTIEGLPVAPEYSEAKLGLIHKSAEGK